MTFRVSRPSLVGLGPALDAEAEGRAVLDASVEDSARCASVEDRMKPGFEILTAFSAADVPAAILGESPAVDEAASKVWWVDTAGQRVFRTDLKTQATAFWDLPEEPGFVVLDKARRPVLGMQTGLFVFVPEADLLEKFMSLGMPGHRFNDATVDANGALWVSTMARDLGKGQAAIYRVMDDLRLKPIVTGLAIPNGMAVDVQRGRLYYSDSHWDVQTVWTVAVDVETGEAGEPVVFASMTDMAGRPDGAVLDSEGRYWIAGVDGAALYVYSPDGAYLFNVPLPVEAPTNLAFWGERGEKLVVTSKGDGDHGGRLMSASFRHDPVGGLKQPAWRHGTSVPV